MVQAWECEVDCRSPVCVEKETTRAGWFRVPYDPVDLGTSRLNQALVPNYTRLRPLELSMNLDILPAIWKLPTDCNEGKETSNGLCGDI